MVWLRTEPLQRKCVFEYEIQRLRTNRGKCWPLCPAHRFPRGIWLAFVENGLLNKRDLWSIPGRQFSFDVFQEWVASELHHTKHNLQTSKEENSAFGSERPTALELQGRKVFKYAIKSLCLFVVTEAVVLLCLVGQQTVSRLICVWAYHAKPVVPQTVSISAAKPVKQHILVRITFSTSSWTVAVPIGLGRLD